MEQFWKWIILAVNGTYVCVCIYIHSTPAHIFHMCAYTDAFSKAMNVLFTERSVSVSNATIERSFQILSASNFQSCYLSIANHAKVYVTKIPYYTDGN